MSIFALIYIFLQKYLVPFLFAIGICYFLYGVIEYFIIGKGGDEERSQHGRELFLKAIGWFAVGLIAYAFVALIGWLSTLSLDTSLDTPNMPAAGATIEERDAVLPVPNVPQR